MNEYRIRFLDKKILIRGQKLEFTLSMILALQMLKPHIIFFLDRKTTQKYEEIFDYQEQLYTHRLYEKITSDEILNYPGESNKLCWWIQHYNDSRKFYDLYSFSLKKDETSPFISGFIFGCKVLGEDFRDYVRYGPFYSDNEDFLVFLNIDGYDMEIGPREKASPTRPLMPQILED